MAKPFRFKKYAWDGVTSLSALLLPSGPLCGVYVLEFSDGSEYVGQSVDFLSRFASHRRHQEGTIVGFSFAEVSPADLNEVERQTIHQHENSGRTLRNSALVHLPQTGPALDLLVDREVQQSWLDGIDTDLVLGIRSNRPTETPSQATRFADLCERSDYPQIVATLADYLEIAVPWPHMNEGLFWSATAYPSTGRSSKHRRVAAISINNVEVVVCFDFRFGPTHDWEANWFVNLDRSTPLPVDVRGRGSFTVDYATVGAVRQLLFSDSPFSAPSVAKAARILAMGLLRKGQGMMGRYHNPLLADALFAALEQRIAKQG